MKRALLLVVSLVATLLILAPPTASAEEGEPECVLRDGVYYCDQVDVFGRVHRPSAYYVIQRARMSRNQEPTGDDFTRDVVESVDQDPF